MLKNIIKITKKKCVSEPPEKEEEAKKDEPSEIVEKTLESEIETSEGEVKITEESLLKKDETEQLVDDLEKKEEKS